DIEPCRLHQLNSNKKILRAILDNYRVGNIPSQRPEPLTTNELDLLHQAIDPLSIYRRITSTDSLFPRTPWEMETRLRNWLMFCLGEHCGLRIGEILKLTVEDIASLTPAGALA